MLFYWVFICLYAMEAHPRQTLCAKFISGYTPSKHWFSIDFDWRSDEQWEIQREKKMEKKRHRHIVTVRDMCKMDMLSKKKKWNMLFKKLNDTHFQFLSFLQRSVSISSVNHRLKRKKKRRMKWNNKIKWRMKPTLKSVCIWNIVYHQRMSENRFQ